MEQERYEYHCSQVKNLKTSDQVDDCRSYPEIEDLDKRPMSSIRNYRLISRIILNFWSSILISYVNWGYFEAKGCKLKLI